MTEEQNMLAVEEPEEPPKKVSGVSCGGPNGELDTGSMLWRKARTLGFKERAGWRTVIPCDRCANGIELRRFTTTGKVTTSGWYCVIGEMETNPCATCNNGKQRRNGRKKVLYDLTNAPIGFEDGLEAGSMRDVIMGEGLRSEPEGGEYRGGSQKTKSEGKGMPRGLMN